MAVMVFMMFSLVTSLTMLLHLTLLLVSIFHRIHDPVEFAAGCRAIHAELHCIMVFIVLS
jgi:Zn-dependent membrane protease YugP